MFNNRPIVKLTSLLTLTLGLCSASLAEDSMRLELTAYENEPGGPQILRQEFSEAQRNIEGRLNGLSSIDRIVAYNNLCVARTMLREYDSAAAACNAAVRQARNYNWPRGMRDQSARVKALNNRGVLNILVGDLDAALADFNRARKIDPTASPAAAQNLTYIREQAEQSVAGTR